MPIRYTFITKLLLIGQSNDSCRFLSKSAVVRVQNNKHDFPQNDRLIFYHILLQKETDFLFKMEGKFLPFDSFSPC